jgi:hypothetical protein
MSSSNLKCDNCKCDLEGVIYFEVSDKGKTEKLCIACFSKKATKIQVERSRFSINLHKKYKVEE